MKKLLIVLGLIITCHAVNGQEKSQVYDSALARKLGADERGMKMYVLVILKTGTNNLEQGKVRDSIFSGHFKNMSRLAEEGKLIIAGPLENNKSNYRGIFILNVPTIDEAKALVQTDPSVSSGIFDVDLYEWYGSAAISEYMKVHNTIVKKH